MTVVVGNDNFWGHDALDIALDMVTRLLTRRMISGISKMRTIERISFGVVRPREVCVAISTGRLKPARTLARIATRFSRARAKQTRKAHHADKRRETNRGGDPLGVDIIPLGENTEIPCRRQLQESQLWNVRGSRPGAAYRPCRVSAPWPLPIVPRPMKPIGYAASIIEPPHRSARARCFHEELDISRVGHSGRAGSLLFGTGAFRLSRCRAKYRSAALNSSIHDE